jgi:hypothetical protein
MSTIGRTKSGQPLTTKLRLRMPTDPKLRGSDTTASNRVMRLLDVREAAVSRLGQRGIRDVRKAKLYQDFTDLEKKQYDTESKKSTLLGGN